MDVWGGDRPRQKVKVQASVLRVEEPGAAMWVGAKEGCAQREMAQCAPSGG